LLDKSRCFMYNLRLYSEAPGGILANIKSAIKRNRQNAKRREHNRIFRGKARTYVKQANAAIEAGDVEKARAAANEAASALDRAASKGVIHKNNAARRKSAVMKKLAALEEGKK
jgi:small subunit ribosomal protein S20